MLKKIVELKFDLKDMIGLIDEQDFELQDIGNGMIVAVMDEFHIGDFDEQVELNMWDWSLGDLNEDMNKKDYLMELVMMSGQVIEVRWFDQKMTESYDDDGDDGVDVGLEENVHVDEDVDDKRNDGRKHSADTPLKIINKKKIENKIMKSIKKKLDSYNL